MTIYFATKTSGLSWCEGLDFEQKFKICILILMANNAQDKQIESRFEFLLFNTMKCENLI